MKPVSFAPAACVATGFLLVATGVLAQASSKPGGEHQHAHVHGVAKLGVAIQDKIVTLQLESPLDSLIGFEHRPDTPAQQAAVDGLKARMTSAKDLFGFDAAAHCTLANAEADSAVFEPPNPRAPGEAHADLDAAFEYRCANPERLTNLDVGLFAAYPKLQRLDVEVATGKGQFKRALRQPARTVALTR